MKIMNIKKMSDNRSGNACNMAMIEEFRKVLLMQKKQAEERLEKTRTHIRHEQGPVSQSFSEQAVERRNDDIVNCLDQQAGMELFLIESALKRIEKGNYGICENCRDAIELERLVILPYTSRCKSCMNSSVLAEANADLSH